MAPIFKIITLLGFSLAVAAQGTQFITGDCTADAQCASTCCAFTSGKCAARFVANERGEGCGFGTGAAILTGPGVQGGGAAAPVANNPVTPAAGTQFITGPCTSDADCAAGCCGFTTGRCAGPVIAQTRDGGCGFGNAQPNDNAARAFLGQRLGRRGPSLM